MAFESLTDKLSLIFKKIKGQARITESNIEEMLKESDEQMYKDKAEYYLTHPKSSDNMILSN